MIKKILLSLLVLILLVIISIIVFLCSFDLIHYRSYIEARFTSALGYPVKILSLSTKLSLIPTVNVNGLLIMDKKEKTVLLQVQHSEATLELIPLIHGQITIPKISIQNANFTLAKDFQISQSNQKKSVPTKGGEKSSEKIWVEEIAIDELKASIQREKQYEFSVSNFSLKGLSKFTFDMNYMKNTVKVSGNLGSVLDLATASSLPVDLTLKQDKSVLKVNGKIGDVKNMKRVHIQTKLNIPNLSSFLKKWNIKNDKIPTQASEIQTTLVGDLEKMTLENTSLTIGKNDLQLKIEGELTQLKKQPTANLKAELILPNSSLNTLWGIKPLEANSQIKVTKSQVSFSEIKLNANKSDLKGQISINWKESPFYIKGDFKSTYLDIRDLLESSKNSSSKTPSKTDQEKLPWTEAKVPYDMLKLANADLKYNITHFKFSEELPDYISIDGTLTLKDGIVRKRF